ncbi:hypothetical protein M5D96_002165 [Drosophila gunungcola]|uniref:Uncharacterized protein n=1 Tax=Drosophila gunungcola TaxID=103775 RepID=A0A9P9Z0B9_9MUSC|nr:hypothetical protein M5D96_002165 [Drosophila gunungcola]
MHPKQIRKLWTLFPAYPEIQSPPDLESCYLKGGFCRELWNCEERYQSRLRTTCINKRKVCCMPTIQMKSLQDAEDYAE